MTLGKETNKEEAVIFKNSGDALSAMLQIEKRIYPLGTPIVINLMVTSKKMDEPVELTFSSAQRYDFVVTKGDKEIWRWSKDKLFAMMMDQITLKPGESLRYTQTWNQREQQGEHTPPGRYEIVGVLKTYPEVVSDPVVVEIGS